MDKDKIENIPSFKNLREEMAGFEYLKLILDYLKSKGIDVPNLDSAVLQIEDIKNQLFKLSTTPDKFNKFFSSRGWIAYESMSQDTMEQCVSLAQENKIDEAEELLVNYYEDEGGIWKLNTFKNIDELRPRYDLIYKATTVRL